jgi:hypothetical protein
MTDQMFHASPRRTQIGPNVELDRHGADSLPPSMRRFTSADAAEAIAQGAAFAR